MKSTPIRLPQSLSKAAGLLFLVALILAAFAGPAAALTSAPPMVVSIVDDVVNSSDGECSLREAVIAANRNSASSSAAGECQPGQGSVKVIHLPAGFYELTRSSSRFEEFAYYGDLDLYNHTTIEAVGPGLAVIHAAYGNDRVIEIRRNKKIEISGVTISGGNTSSFGGGIYNRGDLTLENVTLTGNEANVGGGALHSRKTTTLINVTVTGNEARYGSGLYRAAGTINVINSMIVGDSCRGTIAANSGANINLKWLAPGCESSDFGIEADPQLSARQLGGVDALFEIPAGSPAANLASSALCPDSDQIGTVRPQGAGCDIGAFEAVAVGGPANPSANPDNYTVVEDAVLTVPAAGIFGVLENDSANGSATMHATIVDSPSGDLTFNANGSFVYTPPAQFVGNDTFTYTVTGDGGVPSAPALVTIEVTEDGRIEVINTCDAGTGSLRAAITQANSVAGVDRVIFDIIDETCGDQVIQLASALPAISEPVILDGLMQDVVAVPDRTAAFITVNGQNGAFSGFKVPQSASGTVIQGLVITNFGGSGLLVGSDGPSSNNIFAHNTISNNGSGAVQNGGIDENDGASVCDGVGNQFNGNDFNLNFDQDIDLGCDGFSPNDPGDPDTGANDLQNFPVLLSATSSGKISGLLNSLVSTDFTLQMYRSADCSDTALTALTVTPDTVTTDSVGNVLFEVNVGALPEGIGVFSTATEAGSSNTSEYSNCVRTSDENTTWPSATEGQSGDLFSQYLDIAGQSRWYKFRVTPDSKVLLKLFGLPKNYDLALYLDIASAYAEQVSATNVNLEIIGAETAPANFNPANFNPANFNPANFNPANFNPANFNPANFNPANFNGFQNSGEVTAPAIFAPANFNPANFNPANFNPANFNPANFNGNAYSAAQSASLIAVSANGGTAPEEIQINSWDTNGFMYVRVTGRQADFDPNIPFSLELEIIDGDCVSLNTNLPATSTSSVAGNYKTLILTDLTRMGAKYDAGSLATMQSRLAALANRAEIGGVVVDVGSDAAVAAANAQADSNAACPYAKNLVAEAVKEIVDAYRDDNPNLKYVIFTGSDNDIPFYRIPDTTELGQEENYFVPTDPFSSSDAVQRKNYYLSQDPYVSDLAISKEDDVVYVPSLVSSRLAETPQNIINLITAYENTPVIEPQNAVVTAYDFLSDGGEQVRDVFSGAAGLNVNDDLLVYNPDVWDATQMATVLEEQFAGNSNHGNDLLFVSGHFAPNAALAADYDTFYLASELRDSAVDLSGSLWMSPGCHMAYNVVNEHAIPATFEPDADWVQVFADKGATVISGTAYQYGETIAVDYGERLYYEIARQLRSNAAANIPLGDAVMNAKLSYLIDTTDWSAFDTKTLQQVTIWGIANQAINMPGQRLDLAPSTNSVVNALQDSSHIAGDPADVLGLRHFDLSRTYNSGPQLTTEVFKTLTDIDSNSSIDASYLKLGAAGAVTTAPGKPVVPKDQVDVSFAGTTLRGVLFLGGDIRDFSGRQPLVSVAATEFSTPHPNFFSSVFDPLRLWSINRFDVLSRTGGSTQLFINPAQYKSTSTALETTTLRRFDNLDLRLFYSSFTGTFNTGQNVNEPGLSGAPTINTVSAILNNSGGVDVEALVTVDPSAGVHEVWFTYIAEPNPTSGGASASWQSQPLVQDANDSRIWRYTLPNVANPERLRFIIQAVSGVGLVTMNNNLGHFYSVAGINSDPEPTSTIQLNGPATGYTSGSAQFSAKLVGENGSTGLSDQIVFFGMGSIQFPATTNSNGVATVDLPLLIAPGNYELSAWFLGTADYLPSSTAATIPFEVSKQPTSLDLDVTTGPAAVVISEGDPIPLEATLTDNDGAPLAEKSVQFDVTPTGGGAAIPKAVITKPSGKALLGVLDVPPGTYNVAAVFPGSSVLESSSSPVFSLTVNAVTPPGPCPVVPGNVLTNSCFDDGKTPWILFTNGTGTYEISSDNPFQGDNAAAIAIAQPGTNVQLYQKDLVLEPNTEYELSFAAYSSNGNDMSVFVHRHGSGIYTNYGLHNFVVDLTTDWQQFQTTFTTTNFSQTVDNGRLRFWLAPYDAAGMTYHIDSVVLRKVGAGGTVTAASFTTEALRTAEAVSSSEPPVLVPGPGTCAPDTNNLLANAGFEAGTAGWTFWSDGAGTYTTAKKSPYECANNASVKIRRSGGNVQLYQKNVPLQGGETYQLRLAARSSGGEDVQLFVHKYGAPYTNYGLNGVQLDLTKNWQVFVVEFTTLGEGPLTDAQLRLWLAPYDRTRALFEFDDVVLLPKHLAGGTDAGRSSGFGVDAAAQGASSVPADSVQVQGFFLDGDEAGRLSGGYVPESGESWCYAARPSLSELSPANGKMTNIDIVGLGRATRVIVTDIFQNELVGPYADGEINGRRVALRAERDDSGEGRVYHVAFTASYRGAPDCRYEVIVTVPLDGAAVDNGARYDSTMPSLRFH